LADEATATLVAVALEAVVLASPPVQPQKAATIPKDSKTPNNLLIKPPEQFEEPEQSC